MSRCILSSFERRLYCFKKKVSNECLEPQFLGYRCPNLVWNKEDVIREAKRGRREIVSRCGFTKEAVVYAEKYRPELRLKHRDEIVKPRRSRKNSSK